MPVVLHVALQNDRRHLSYVRLDVFRHREIKKNGPCRCLSRLDHTKNLKRRAVAGMTRRRGSVAAVPHARVRAASGAPLLVGEWRHLQLGSHGGTLEQHDDRLPCNEADVCYDTVTNQSLMPPLSSRVAIVTGSGLGIGRAVATVLARAGAKARPRPSGARLALWKNTPWKNTAVVTRDSTHRLWWPTLTPVRGKRQHLSFETHAETRISTMSMCVSMSL